MEMFRFSSVQFYLARKPVQSQAVGFAVGAITEKRKGSGWNVLAIAVACVIKVVGYYIAEGFIYGNWAAPVASIPGNLVQIGVAAVIVLLVIGRLQKLVK